MTTLRKIAERLNSFTKEYDLYEYWHRVEDEDAQIAEIEKDLAAGETEVYTEVLQEAIEELEDDPLTGEAESLLALIENIGK